MIAFHGFLWDPSSRWFFFINSLALRYHSESFAQFFKPSSHNAIDYDIEIEHFVILYIESRTLNLPSYSKIKYWHIEKILKVRFNTGESHLKFKINLIE